MVKSDLFQETLRDIFSAKRPNLRYLFFLYIAAMAIIFYFIISFLWNFASKDIARYEEEYGGFFTVLVFLFKLFIVYIVYVWLLFSIGSLVCSLISHKIFDELELLRKKKYKYKRKKNHIFLSVLLVILSFIIDTFLNIILIPILFFFPIANIFVWSAVNGFFCSTELPGVYLVKYHDRKFRSYFNALNRGQLFWPYGCMTSFLCGIPVIGFFIPFISSVVFAKIVLDYKE